MATDASNIKALVFDVFGTVVDWHTSVTKHAERFGEANGITADWVDFAESWRAKYRPFMDKVRNGELPWTELDSLHRMDLEELLNDFGITGVSEEAKADLNLSWHRLDPWPDSPPGLTRLKAKFILATMSNGNIALMVDMAKYANLPWDTILGAELAHAYKPDPKTYLTGVELLHLKPEQVMMVAAHQGDLLAAAKQGLRTAFVKRPMERGINGKVDTTPDPSFDFVCNDFRDLATQLGV